MLHEFIEKYLPGLKMLARKPILLRTDLQLHPF